MLVHIVTPANRSFYSEYLPKMFEQRREVFVDWLKWPDLNVIDGMERDEIDEVPEVEYLLTLNEFGKLVGSTRFAPTLGPHLLAGPLRGFVDRPYECSPHTWEWTRYAPTQARETPNAKAARALMVTAVQEWALRRGVSRLLGISDATNLAFAARIGWKSRPLGLPKQSAEGELATAVEFEIDAQSLAATRKFWQLDQAVTYYAPPSLTDQPISQEEIGVLDAVLNLAQHERPQFMRILSRLGKDDDALVAAERANMQSAKRNGGGSKSAA
jgi:N-acyl-L-homoserine lactone synthetase